jgi:hypothetical protein
MMKLCDKLSRLEQQIVFISKCIRIQVFPNTIQFIHLPECLASDTKTRICIQNQIIRKLLRKLYSLRYSTNNDLEKTTNAARNGLHPTIFDFVQNLCNINYNKQSEIQRSRLNRKLNWILLKRGVTRVESSTDLSFNPKLLTNLSNQQPNADTMNLLSKGPNFAISHNVNNTVILNYQAGFQRLIHQVRWWIHHQLVDTERNPGSDNDTKFPIMREFQQYTKAPTHQETEDTINKTASEFDKVMTTLKKTKLKPNIEKNEKMAGNILRNQSAEIIAIESDKGKDFCLIERDVYLNAVSLHLNSAVYRRLTNFDIRKIETRVNEKWSEIANSRSIPSYIIKHYKMFRSVFPQMNGRLKTHKDNPTSIRPVINSINGPCYKLTFLIYSILKPLESKINYRLTNSESLISEIKSLDPETLIAFPYPFSLDVIDMYTNVPSMDAARIAVDMATQHKLNLFGLLNDNIMELIRIIIDNNFFLFNGKLYKQMIGLPMGSRISGLLANIYLDYLEKSIVPTLPIAIYKRYVDDIFILTKDSDSADNIANQLNNISEKIKFEMEKPINGKLNLLDFGVMINNGKAKFSFYQKKARSNVFVNFNSHVPMMAKRHYVQNEWMRILRKSDKHDVKRAKKTLEEKLLANNYPQQLINKWTLSTTQRNRSQMNSKIFYLSIPYINDGINNMIKRSLRPLGLNIRLSHKNRKLKSWIKASTNQPIINCSLANCRLKNEHCLKSMVIYECKCTCGDTYIGSTERQLHIRIKEHFTLHNSAMFQHRLTCDNKWHTSILANGIDITDLRIKEAILIKQRHPSLNRKEELRFFNLVV